MKIFFIASSGYVLYLMKVRYRCVRSPLSIQCGGQQKLTPTSLPARPTQDPAIDTFRLEYIIGPSIVLGLIFNYKLCVPGRISGRCEKHD